MNRKSGTWRMRKHISPQLGLAYLEGQLDAAQQAKVKRHLADCADCREILQQHQATHNLLRAAGQDLQMQPVPVPAWQDARSRRARRDRWDNTLRLSGQLATTVLLVLLVATTAVFLLNRPPTEIEPAAPTVTAAAPTTVAATATPTAPTPLVPTPTELAAAILISPQVPDVAATVTPAGMDPTAVPATVTATPIASLPAAAPAVVPLLSPSGRLAVVQERILWVETAVGSHNLVEIARNVNPTLATEDGPVANPPAAWSPDGTRLAFFYEAETAVPPARLGIWDSSTNQVQSLARLVEKAVPEVPFTSYRWSPEGSRLLLTTSDPLSDGSEWTSGVWIADLEHGDLTLVVEARQLVDTAWLSADSFFLALDCGQDCATMIAYDTERRQLWKPYETVPASSFYTLNVAQGLLVHLNTFARQPRVDVIDTATGDVTAVSILPAGQTFVRRAPHLAPHAPYLAYNTAVSATTTTTLHLIDLDGRDYGTRENSVVLDWRPEGGPVLAQAVAGDNSQLVYWPLDGAAARIFVQPRAFTFSGGRWSADGQYFIYSALDPAVGASYLYLWQPETGVPVLLLSAAATEPFQDFTWTADGRRVYVTLGGSGLWQYDVETAEVSEVSIRETEGETGILPENPN